MEQIQKGFEWGFMGNFISKNLSLGLTLFAVYWLYKKLDMSSKAVTKPIGNALAEIQMWANGSHPIYREWTGFYLDPDKLDQHTLYVTHIGIKQ